MALLAKSKGEVSYRNISSVHKWSLITLISIGSSVIYTPMYLKNVFYDELMGALGTTNAQLGLMVSIYGLTALICYLPSGIVADKFRMRTLATWGFILTAVVVFFYGLLPSVGICYLLFVLMGITSILIWWGTRFKVVRLCCGEDEYSSRIGISYTIYGATGLGIGLINAAIIAAIGDVIGVQTMLMFLAALILVLGIISYFLIPDFENEINKDAKLFSLKEAGQAFTHPGVIWACIAYFCVYAVYQGATYTTPYLTGCFDAGDNIVNVVGLIRTYGIALVAGPVAGFIAQKFKPSRTILCAFFLAIALLIVFIFYPHNPGQAMVACVLVIVFGFATYGAFSVGSAPLSEVRMPMSIFGTATGILSVIGFLPDVFIHTWYGSLIDAHGNAAFSSIFGFEIMFAVIGCFGIFMLIRSIRKHRDKAPVESSDNSETEVEAVAAE